MKDLSVKARIYILSISILGVLSFFVGLQGFSSQNVWVTAGLGGIGALAMIFKVVGATERSHYNISFVVYMFAFFTYGVQTALLVLLISHLIEWIWHKYPWYIQAFNLSQFAVAMVLCETVVDALNPFHTFTHWVGVLSVLAGLAVFTGINHVLVGFVVWVARGENFKQSGVLDSFSLLLDYSMQVLGFVTALIWSLSPFGIVAVLIVLYLTYSTLKVPSLERKTEIDPKTKLFNARYFARALEKELDRANRFDRPLTVIMGDLDLLRNINNTYGHLAGDVVLVGIANILRSSVREYDTVARFGGEEFAILMPETRSEEAYDHLEKIRRKIERTEFTVDTSVAPIKATMSFGIADRLSFSQTTNDIVHNSDVALYHAKSTGRNRCAIYSGLKFENVFGNYDVPPRPINASLEDRIAPSPYPYEPSELREPQKAQDPAGEDFAGKKMNSGSSQEEHDSDFQDGSTSKINIDEGRRPSWVMDIYIGGVVLLSLITFGAVLVRGQLPTIELVGYLLFAALVFVSEWFSIDIYQRNTAISTSAAPLLGGILLFGPMGALGLCLIFALAAKIKHKSPWKQFAFNFGNQLLAGMSFYLLLLAIGIPFVELPMVSQFLLSLLASGIVYFITTALVAYVISLSQNGSFMKTWDENYRWLAPYFFGMGVVSFGLIMGYRFAGIIGILVVIVPLYFLRFSQQQYLSRTKEMVQQLRESNLVLGERSGEIEKLSEDLLQSIAYLVDMHNPNLYGHSNQVVNYAVKTARQLKLPPQRVELVRKAAILHDIGKLGIPDHILSKPYRLTEEEYNIMKTHPQIGEQILSRVDTLKPIAKIVLHHHERWDGAGYPMGIKAQAIPLESRIIGLADAVEAMASDRPYRKAQDADKIRMELLSNKGTQFDPQVVDAFLSVLVGNGTSLLKNSAVETNGFVRANEILNPLPNQA